MHVSFALVLSVSVLELRDKVSANFCDSLRRFWISSSVLCDDSRRELFYGKCKTIERPLARLEVSSYFAS